MSYFSSLGTVVQIGPQSQWATSAQKTIGTPTKAIPATAEAMQMTVERLEPTTMLAENFKKVSLASTASCAGSVSAPLTADYVNEVFKALMGTEASISKSDLPTIPGITESATTITGKKYTFGSVGALLPLLTMVMKRGNEELATYPNLTLNSLSLSCANNQTCDATLNFIGTEEILGTGASDYTGIVGKDLSSGVEASAIPYINNKSILVINDGVRCAESVDITIDNQAQDAPRCFQDGQLSNRPYFGRKMASLAVSMPWDGSNGLYKELKGFYHGNNTLEAAFRFEDPNGHKILIHCPACYVSEDSYNASGDGLIGGSINLDVAECSCEDGEYGEGDGGVIVYVYSAASATV